MHLSELFSEAELQAQMDAAMVKATPHPSGKLTILSYTKRAQYTPELWNHVTDKCRGLIVDNERNIVARPFEKFWNIDDARHPETLMANLPATPPLLTRKLDGSLGIGYQLDGKWQIATRGAFLSEQALWASDWLERNSPSLWPEGHTPLFEIVYPDNQIVVRYEYSGLVLLALVKIATGEELPYPELLDHGARNNIQVVEAFDRPLAACLAEDVRNEEGYVAAWPRPGTTPLRCKIKYSNYVRLHRLLTQTNAVTVWEMLRDGLDVSELTTDVPDEFRWWIDSLVLRFHTEFSAIEDTARAAFDAYTGDKDAANPESKKAFALYVMAHHKELAGILFAMIGGKDYKQIIFKAIRPRGDEEKTFKEDDS
jgi:RNA ligase